jgi:hypothetical protein
MLGRTYTAYTYADVTADLGAERTADLLADRSPLSFRARRDWQDVSEAVYLARASGRRRAAAAGDTEGEGEPPAG